MPLKRMQIIKCNDDGEHERERDRHDNQNQLHICIGTILLAE